jgi:ATP-dependent DNA helicase RecG
MYGKKKYKRISTRAKILLNQEEGFDVDFKKNTNLSGEDLVAFANSKNGGTILLGVDEKENKDGTQNGLVIGCDVSDGSKMAIVNKANQCIPHINISIHIENLNAKPFYRIEIPSSKNKPHCTQKGIYKTRGDGANKPLLPQELLRIYLDSESDNFLKNYSKATIEMRNELQSQHKNLIQNMWNSTFETQDNIQEAVSGIGTMLDDVHLQIEDSQSDLQSLVDEIKEETSELKQDLEITYDTKYKLKEVDKNIINVAWKLNSILEHLNLEDPEITYERDKYKAMLQYSRSSFEKHLPDKKFTEKEIKKHVQKIYDNANSIIKGNYKIEDLIEWYKGNEFLSK